MRTVRSLRVFLALGVGLMALTAGLAETVDSNPPADNTAVDTTGTAPAPVEPEPVPVSSEPAPVADAEDTGADAPAPDAAAPAPDAEKEDNTVVTTTTMDPDAAAGTPDTTDKAADEPVVTPGEVIDTATEILGDVTDGETEGDIIDGIKSGADAVQGDKADTPIVDAAEGITEVLPDELPATTQVQPEVPSSAGEAVGNVADTTANLAETGAEAASGSLGTGALANQFATSDNVGVATAAQVAGQILQSGIVDPKMVQSLAGGANPQAAAGLSALANGAEIASGLSACQASIEGDEAAIQQSFTALGASMVSSDSISGAAAMGQSLIQAWATANGEAADPMYQLFRIYLDQHGNAGKTLTTAQSKAYSQLTPQCNSAFDDIVETYNDSKGTVSSLLAGGNKNVTCSNYKNADTAVDMTLCVWPSAVWTKEEKIMANVTATFTNYGVQLCDVSFYVINLEKALAKSPAWLPDANTAFPNGIPKGAEVAIEASVPWTQDIAANAPIVDILKGWSACPNGKVAPEPAAPKPTPRPTEKTDSGVLGTASACFLTTECQKAVAPYSSDACAAYSQLLSSGCSTCSPTVLKSAQASCLQSCATTYCGLPGEAADKGVTSGAGAVSRAFAFLATLAMGVAAAFAL